MNREWRRGTIRLVLGYTLLDAAGQPHGELADVEFALEGGFVNVRVAGRDDTQIISAPALAHIKCHTL